MYKELAPSAYNNIDSATTTVVKNKGGNLKAIVINTTSAGSITVYDNTSASGKKIATLKANVAEGTYEYNCRFGIGLTVVTAGASDITVLYM